MHVRDFCLCADCVARITVHDDETRVRAILAIACAGRAKHSEQIAVGLRKRAKVAA